MLRAVTMVGSTGDVNRAAEIMPGKTGGTR